jgi:geranylgeranyl diphosphate synthase type I
MTSETTEARVLETIRERRELVNAAIDEELPIQHPERLYEASRYILEAGGKRLRPTVTTLSAEAVTGVEPMSADYREFVGLNDEPVDVMRAAVSIEVIQSFTLIHDDIMDDDDLRRGVPAVHREYDVPTAILAGDTLFSTAFELMSATGAAPADGLDAVRMLAETCTSICEGQSLDVAFEGTTEVLPEEYLEMIEDKTAVLYGAAAATPAVLMGADDATVEALYRYGLDVGRAFQIQDDVLDLTVTSERLGKQRGSDLVEGKETLITLHARQQGVDVDGLLAADDPESVREADVERAVADLEAAGSIDHARETAAGLVRSSKDRLATLPDNEARSLLADIADFLITRGY